MPVPNLGIRSNPIVNFKVIELIGAGARAMSAALQERRRVELQREQMQQEAAQHAQNMALKQQQLQLQQENLKQEQTLKQAREQRLETQGERRLQATESRAETARQSLELRRRQLVDVDPGRQAAIKGGVLGLAKHQLRTPLLDADGQPSQELAHLNDKDRFDLGAMRLNTQGKLDEWNNSEKLQFENPGRGEVLERELNLLTQAENQRARGLNEAFATHGHLFGINSPGDIAHAQAAAEVRAADGNFGPLDSPEVSLNAAADKGVSPANADTAPAPTGATTEDLGTAFAAAGADERPRVMQLWAQSSTDGKIKAINDYARIRGITKREALAEFRGQQ